MQIHVVILSYLHGSVLTHCSLFFQVNFVREQNYRCVLVLHFVNRLNPVLNRLIACLVRNVKAKNDAIGLSVKLVCYVSEFFLASGVPNLDLHFLIILLVVVLTLNVVDSNGLQVILLEATFVQAP